MKAHYIHFIPLITSNYTFILTCNIEKEALGYRDDLHQDCLSSSRYRLTVPRDYGNYFGQVHNDGDRRYP